MSQRSTRLAAGMAAATALVVAMLAWPAREPEHRPVGPEVGSSAAGTLAPQGNPGTRSVPGAVAAVPGTSVPTDELRAAVAAAPQRVMERPTVILVGPSRSTASFHGRVLDLESGAAICGAEVRIGVARDDRTTAPAAVSDAHGRFRLDVGTGSATPLRIDAAGYAGTTFPAGPAFDDPSRAAEVRLQRGASLELRATDGGPPCVDARISVRVDAPFDELRRGSPELADLGIGELAAKTDGAGRVRFDSVPVGKPLSIRIAAGSGPDVAFVEPALRPGELREVVVSLRATSTIRGRLLDRDGHPVPGHEILREPAAMPLAALLHGSSGETRSFRLTKDGLESFHLPAPIGTAMITDHEGAFELRDVAPGRWHVGPRTLAPFAGLAPCIEVGPSSRTIELELLVDRDLFVRGQVVADGGPPPRCTVDATSADPSHRARCSTVSAADGSFQLGPLPAGLWNVQAVPSSSRHGMSDVAVVESGTSGVVLALGVHRPPLHAILFDGRSNQRRDGEAAIVVKGGTDVAFRRVPHDGAGLADFQSGHIVVLGRTADGFFGREAVDSASRSARELVVDLSPGARLSLHNDSGERVRFLVRAEDLPIASGSLAPGAREVVVVPPGSLRVEWRDPAGSPRTIPAHVSAGEERTVAWPR